jgi:NAD(P)-dependent dehydrogenase (short-subunit alcohol dehydrogenase family)
MTARLQNKVAVITGGGSGMGLASAEKFVAHGARVVIADIDKQHGEAAAARLGSNSCFVLCDVSVEAAVENAVATAVDRFGGLDIMFCNAGIQGTTELIENMRIDAWDAALAVLLRGPLLGIKHAVPPLRARGGGSIIVTASNAGLRGGLGTAAYAVGKAAAIQLVRMAAGELAADRIRVNSICPGFTATSIFGKAMGESPEIADRMVPYLKERFAAMQPLPKAGLPEDIADAAVFLASEESAFITGTELVVDGGMMVKSSTVIAPGVLDPVASVLMEARDAAVAHHQPTNN